jgi:hypothetical protein
VKGTQFRVSVGAAGTSVKVLRGQVEVADFKSGQIAQVLPGQAAKVFAQGKSGLVLSGSGTFMPIVKGESRTPSIERVTVPRTRYADPRSPTNGQQIRALGQGNRVNTAMRSRDVSIDRQRTAVRPHASHGMRISSSLGDVRLNFDKVTHGMARGTSLSASGSDRRGSANKDTIWSSRNAKASMGVGGNSNQGNAGESGNGSGVIITTSANAAAAAASNSAKGNGNAIANGNGNAIANGNGHDNENGHGHGHGYGHSYSHSHSHSK